MAKSQEVELAERQFAVRLGERLTKIARAPVAKTVDVENRQSDRLTTYLIGVVTADGATKSCLIINRGEYGLRLQLHEAASLPDQFALSIPSLRIDGVVRKRWAVALEVGVEFLVWDGPLQMGLESVIGGIKRLQPEIDLPTNDPPNAD